MCVWIGSEATLVTARRLSSPKLLDCGRPYAMQHAGRDPGPVGRRRMGRTIGEGRAAVRPSEARRERADALQADHEADLRHRAVGAAQQGRRAFEPAREQVLVRRLAERLAELAAEVRGREVRGACERGDVERLAVARVDEVLRAQQMSGRRVRLIIAPRVSRRPTDSGRSRGRAGRVAARFPNALAAIDS